MNQWGDVGAAISRDRKRQRVANENGSNVGVATSHDGKGSEWRMVNSE
jgi:hypothetical protein